MQDFKKRKFKFWFYHATHGEAIIRSAKNNEFDKNIDLYFGDVQYIEMPTMITELRLEKADEADIAYLTKRMGRRVLANNVTVLVSGENRYYIVASINKIMENSLEMNELPILTFIKCSKI